MRNPAATSKRHGTAFGAVVAALAAAALGCAGTAPERQQIGDPLEPMNRSLFALNEWVDQAAFGPLARGYERVAPEPLRLAVANAERNLGFPVRFVSHLGQANFLEAGSELGRFLLNSTLGLGGLLDPASEAGLAEHDTDLGRMLASWHVPPGPYLMLPLFGPSNGRDAFADLVATAMNPLAWTTPAAPPVAALFAVNRRAEADEKIRIARESALDLYVFVRDAYIQRRTREIRGEYVTRLREGEIPDDPMGMPEDLYDVQTAESVSHAVP